MAYQNFAMGGGGGYGAAAGSQIKRPTDVQYGGEIGANGQRISAGSGGGGGGYSFGYNALDPIGYDTYTKTSTSQELAQKEQYNRDREKRYQDWINQMMPSLQGTGNMIMANFQAGTGGPGQPNAHIEAPDASAANAASFARAKDQAGQIAQSALQGLRSSLGGRGLLGSGAEFRGTGNIAAKGMGQLGDVNREQAIQNAAAAQDFAKTAYAGDITQRGQDISQMQGQNALAAQLAMADYQGQIQQRGQNISQMQALMGLMKY